jgi:pimeloyl-ACP methyl ester carboxylesterase
MLIIALIFCMFTGLIKGSAQQTNHKNTVKIAKSTIMDSRTETIDSTDIFHRYTTINGIKYHYAEAGKGPLVIMLHGFPEFWYSWRHQLSALAKAGYHAIAPDLRGFGESEVTKNVEDYSLTNHAKDIKALIDHLGEKEVFIIGHDWGANLMWIMPMLYPETVKGVISLSIPFYPEPRDPVEIRKKWPNTFTNFHTKGATEAEFNENPERFFRLFFYGLSGDAPKGLVDTLFLTKPHNNRVLDNFIEPGQLPSWLSQKDLDRYVAAYKKTGMTPALNFYRNDQDYFALKDIYKKGIHQPALFIGGASEAAVRFGSTEPMKAALPNLRKAVILEHCGHWLQQEKPDEVNKEIISFLNAEFKNH